MKAKPFLLLSLGAMALMVAGSIYLAATTEKAHKEIVALASPDGKYKAVRLTVSGEHPAPFCVDTVAIFLSIYPDSFVVSDSNYEIYSGPCAAPDKRVVLPKIEWLSEKTVRITYASPPAGEKQPHVK
ncbi:MAG TPA: hypothetical protein VII35_07460, partial [Steroidobacteraceae bacterium]